MTKKKDAPKIRIMPNRVLVRLADKAKDDVFFGKEFKCKDGSKTRLIIAVDTTDDMDRKSRLFRRTGEVMQVGRHVRNIEVGDTAILDYKVDNDSAIEVGHDGIGKLMAVLAVTEYVKEGIVVSANRQIKKDQYVAREGEVQVISDIIGVIRGEKIHAQDPYVLLKYDPFAFKQSSTGLIFFEEKKTHIGLEVIAVSDISREKYGIIEGSVVEVKESDTFRIDLADDVIIGVDDFDVRMIRVNTSGKTKEEVYKEVLK